MSKALLRYEMLAHVLSFSAFLVLFALSTNIVDAYYSPYSVCTETECAHGFIEELSGYEMCSLDKCLDYYYESLKKSEFTAMQQLVCEASCKLCLGVEDFAGIEDADEELFSTYFGDNSNLAKHLVYNLVPDLNDFRTWYKTGEFHDWGATFGAFDYMVLLSFYKEIPDMFDPINKLVFKTKISPHLCAACGSCMLGEGTLGPSMCLSYPCTFYPCMYNCESISGTSIEFYCKGDELWKRDVTLSYKCSSDLPMHGKCVIDNAWQTGNDEKIGECEYGCHQNSLGSTTSAYCIDQELCYKPDNCFPKWYGNPYCKDGDLYGTYRDFDCVPNDYGYKECVVTNTYEKKYLDCGDFDCVDGVCRIHESSSKEICNNGLDDDFDGMIDEECKCQDGEQRSCGIEVGECQEGIETCVNGEWGECEGEVLPVVEGCEEDGKDNDCDGIVDNIIHCDGKDYCGDDEWYLAADTDKSFWIDSVEMKPYCGTEWDESDGEFIMANAPPDNDGDGYNTNEDCNDNDPNVRPPKNNEYIYSDLTLCPCVYDLRDGLKIYRDNVRLDCNGALLRGSLKDNYGVYSYRDGIKIENCNISDYYIGIYLSRAENFSVFNNNLEGNYYGMYLYYSADGGIQNNHAEGNNYGLRLYRSDKSVISDNTFADNLYYGIYLYRSYRNDIWNNIFYGRGITERYCSENDFCSGGSNSYYNGATGPAC